MTDIRLHKTKYALPSAFNLSSFAQPAVLVNLLSSAFSFLPNIYSVLSTQLCCQSIYNAYNAGIGYKQRSCITAKLRHKKQLSVIFTAHDVGRLLQMGCGYSLFMKNNLPTTTHLPTPFQGRRDNLLLQNHIIMSDSSLFCRKSI